MPGLAQGKLSFRPAHVPLAIACFILAVHFLALFLLAPGMMSLPKPSRPVEIELVAYKLQPPKLTQLAPEAERHIPLEKPPQPVEAPSPLPAPPAPPPPPQPAKSTPAAPKPAAPAKKKAAPKPVAEKRQLPAAPAPAPPPPRKFDGPADYVDIVKQSLRAAMFYPPEAARRGAKGRVTFSFTIGRNGLIKAFSIYRSSGDPVLDAAAAQIVKSLRLPPPPGGELSARSVLAFGED